MLRDPNFVAGTVHTKYVEQTCLKVATVFGGLV